VSKLGDYVELIKPRLTALALFSGSVGYVAAVPGGVPIPWLEVLHLTIALGFVGAASNIMNQAMEHRLDTLMDRTAGRPIPTGRIKVAEAKVASLLSLIIGLGYLQLIFDAKVTALALVTFLSYVVLYTPMKTKTSLNTIVGAFPGALPTLCGWVACRGNADFQGFVLFAILFVWQLPHFFSIAWIFKDDYRKAGYKMISLYDRSGRQAVALIVIGTLGLIPLSFMPCLEFVGHTGDIYFLGTFVADAMFFFTALLLIKDRAKYMKMYFYASIIWLPFVLTLMMLDRK
jgi:protoheme IX farnesyltransferase